MFVLGAHLRSKNGPRPPIFALCYLYAFRFLIMPAISSTIVWGVRRIIGSKIIQDPILDFVMIVSPVGPPALTLAAVSEHDMQCGIVLTICRVLDSSNVSSAKRT